VNVSTYLYWLAKRIHEGKDTKADKQAVWEATPYLALTWPPTGWPAEMDETKVMRILLAAAIAESEGK
jgi:hypothetical protein